MFKKLVLLRIASDSWKFSLMNILLRGLPTQNSELDSPVKMVTIQVISEMMIHIRINLFNLRCPKKRMALTCMPEVVWSSIRSLQEIRKWNGYSAWSKILQYPRIFVLLPFRWLHHWLCKNEREIYQFLNVYLQAVLNKLTVPVNFARSFLKLITGMTAQTQFSINNIHL